MGNRLNWRALALLSTGHVFNDTNQGAVAALLPYLLLAHHLSYVAVSALILAATVSSSVVQPIFGHWSDRHSLGWLVPLGIATGGIGLALTGYMPSYPLLFAAIVLSGLGVAVFHPEGSRLVNDNSGNRLASGMSFFAVGGNLGFALGPALVVLCLSQRGLVGTGLLAIPAVLVALILFVSLPTLKPDARATRLHTNVTHSANWSAFRRLAGVIMLRSFAYFGLISFAPLFAVSVLKRSRTEANLDLTLMLVVATLATLVVGRLADRLSRKVVASSSMSLAAILLVGFVLAPAGNLSLALLVLGGAALVAPFNITIVMGQEFLPGRVALASGVTFGLAIGLGGVGATLLGVVADHVGLVMTLLVIAVLPLAGAALNLTLPATFSPDTVHLPVVAEPRDATPF